MRFKPGDIARIRDDLTTGRKYVGTNVIDNMLRFRGKAAKITEMVYDFGYRIEGSPSLWTNEMFESVAVGAHRKPVLRENVDRCVFCGDIVPEGLAVCWQCEHGYGA
jgi:hypothetical protein